MACSCDAVEKVRGLRHGPLILDSLELTYRALLPKDAVGPLARSEVRFAVCYLTSSGWSASSVKHFLLDHLGMPRLAPVGEVELAEMVVSAQPLADRGGLRRSSRSRGA
jgi:hypothetical protein